MTEIGRIIRDAWAFGIIPETEMCEGWSSSAILDELWGKVNEVWEKYGFQVNQLPDDIKKRYLDIQTKAIRDAKANGWEPEAEDG